MNANKLLLTEICKTGEPDIGRAIWSEIGPFHYLDSKFDPIDS